MSCIAEMGPIPRPAQFGRWATLIEADASMLPPTKEYVCLRTAEPITVDGRLDEGLWQRVQWSEPFGAIADGAKVPLETRIAMVWDDRALYVAYKVQDHDIRGSMTNFNDHVYLQDEDVELFFEGDGHYYEIGLNPLNNSYQIRWTWVQGLVEQQRFAELEALFKTPDVLYYTARQGDKLGRHADLSYQLAGLQQAVHIDGTINCPAVRDEGWTVELALPWESLRHIATERPLPPRDGDSFRMTAYRGHHNRQDQPGEPSDLAVRWPWEGWTWSVMGNDNIHVPQRWNRVVFSNRTV